MKKLLPVTGILLVLLSGMNLSVAAHYCEGRLAALRISFRGSAASCDMEQGGDALPLRGTNISAHCCTDDMSTFRVDENYAPSDYPAKEIFNPVITTPWFLPVQLSSSANLQSPIHPHTGSPGCLLTSAVYLTDICMIRN